MKSNEEEDIILEITLISAQSLKTPSPLLRRLETYAIIYPPSPLSPSPVILRTRTDIAGSTNPTWNDKFLLRLPLSSLSPSSSSSISVHIFAHAGFLRPDPLVGSVRLLLSNHRLLSRPKDLPTFAALGIRRPSGRFHGVLNVAFTLLSKVPNLVHLALAAGPAVGFRDLMNPLNVDTGTSTTTAATTQIKKLKKKKKNKGKENENKENGHCGLGLGLGLGLGSGLGCGLGLRQLPNQNNCRIHVGPSDEILNLCQFPWLLKDRMIAEEEEESESISSERGPTII